MKKIGCLWLFLFLFMIQSQMVEVSASTVNADPINPSTLESLRHGGYILYVRHGEATIGVDQQHIIYKDCATQRNLSEEGRKQSVSFGDAFRRLHIPVHYPVIASPFCRTRETAELAFGKQNVQIDPYWIKIYQLGGHGTPSDQANTLTELTNTLEKVPVSGTNTVIVDHGFPQGIGLGEIPYLGTVVVKPKGRGNGYDIVDRISLEKLTGSP
ncbi:histidine phosphatase family protein [Paenibacillus terrigena]|uniref:histidine phosphatase family protein n=1 Tax=Paenibacillus terrigena TaxID=369333 RepID=UPI0028D2A0AE|nr:histidine phosphatase family protein [Paenibacillus terrigena]